MRERVGSNEAQMRLLKACPSRAVLCSALLAGLTCCSEASYTCGSGEAVGEIQGETGSICAPRCSSDGAFTCPLDVPTGTTAQPQCMLQDVSQAAFCGLLCTVDSQCPSGASCKRVGSPEVSVCIHPLSFSDWAAGQGSRTKLAVGWPAKAGQTSRGFQIAKAYAALQSLKRRYGIADGDGDVLIVKELLSAASVAGLAAAPASTGASPLQAAAAATAAAPAVKGQAASDGGILGPWRHDLAYFAGNMEAGLPGLEREVEATVWKVEHLGHRNAASDLLRGVIMVAVVYFGVGSAYKYQALGARGLDMVPHVGFWMEYPNLVADGVKYASALVSELCGGRPAMPMGMPSGGMAGADRDTFANFTPSK